ncbi:NAD(P)-binding protein [Daldinia caldariorum]|uniref:NAD(P)-binding protein n=1 Tax=Daldinia caldariorum TaxID=326644 RepID=UPI0020074FAF|nr:NAD(P)-binding protein [Daldinia caldariorum]KAI1470002.1 NAD(P)-binding protein [Daldinia caldariorum]
MVQIVVAGGSGEVAQEVINALVATKKHDITIFSRKVTEVRDSNRHGVTWRQVNYENKVELVAALQGVDTVLSFIQLLHDPGNKAQKSLIDAAVIAGVKRFAPSEWGSCSGVGMPWWTGKDEVKEYLRKVNENKKVLEYCLFQPGLFLNYLATPHKTSKHLTPLNTFIDIHNRRAIVVEGHDPIMTFTTIQDMAAVVAQAVEFEGEWPVVGGIRGNSLPVSKIIEIAEQVRGGPFEVDTVKFEDLEVGNLTTSWKLEARHHSVTDEEAADMLKGVLVGMLLSSAKGAWNISDEWNQLLPDYRFTDMSQFLGEIWQEKA